MPAYSKSGYFGYAGGGKDGAIVDMWMASRFGSAPAQDTAPPSGSPDAGPVTTGVNFGGPGAYTVTGIATLSDYYIRAQYGGHAYWTLCSANDLAGAPVASGVTSVSGDTTTIAVANPTTTPVVSRAALLGDITSPAGSAVTTLVGTSNVNTVVGGLAALAAKAPLASPTFTGIPAVPTAAQGTHTTQAASTAFATTLFGVGSSIIGGTPPSSGFLRQAGGFPATFTSGFAAVPFPQTFPNGLLSVNISVEASSLAQLSWYSPSLGSIEVVLALAGTAYSGGANIFMDLVGW